MRWAAVLMVLCVLGCGDDGSTGDGERAKPQAGEVTLPPEATFAQHCARCHGPEGMFYARPFNYQGDELRRIVREMMIDKAGLDPTDADVQAMLEYHLSMREKPDDAMDEQDTPR